MPARWKPWLVSLLVANMILPWCFPDRPEAWLVFGVALLNGALFVVLTACGGFTRLLGLGHLFWIPMLFILWPRLSEAPLDQFFGIWLHTVWVLDALCLLLDFANVVRYVQGDREELVAGL